MTDAVLIRIKEKKRQKAQREPDKGKDTRYKGGKDTRYKGKEDAEGTVLERYKHRSPHVDK